MPWELKAIKKKKKKLDGQVNINTNNVEIEIPYYKNFKDTDTIKVDKRSYTIFSATNVGDRNETIFITTMEKHNEHDSKQVKG